MLEVLQHLGSYKRSSMKYTLATIEAVEALQVDAEQTRITAVGNLFSPPKSVAWRSLEWPQIVSKKGHLPSAVRFLALKLRIGKCIDR